MDVSQGVVWDLQTISVSWTKKIISGFKPLKVGGA